MFLSTYLICISLFKISLTGGQSELENNVVYDHVNYFIDRKGSANELDIIESEIGQIISSFEKTTTEGNEKKNSLLFRDLLMQFLSMIFLGMYRNNGLVLDDDGEDSANSRQFRQLMDEGIENDEDGAELTEDIADEARLFQNGYVMQFPGETLRRVSISYLTQTVGRWLNMGSFGAANAVRILRDTSSSCGTHNWRDLLQQYSFLRHPWMSYYGEAEQQHYSFQFSSRIREAMACLQGDQKARIKLNSLLSQYKMLIDNNLKQKYEIRKSDSSSLDELVNAAVFNLYAAVDEAKEALEKDQETRQSTFGQLLFHKLNGWTLLTLGRNMATFPNDDVSLAEVPFTHWYLVLGNVFTYIRFSLDDFEKLAKNKRLNYSDPACGNGPLYNVLHKYSHLLYGGYLSSAKANIDVKKLEMELKLSICCLLDQGSTDISTLTGKGKSAALNYRIDEVINAVQTRVANL